MRRDMLLLAAFLMAPPTLAQQQPDYQIHGFAAQGFVLTSDNNLFGDSEDGSLEFRELGINGQWQPLDRLGFSGQLLSRRAGEADDGDPVIDFLFADLNLYQGNRGGDRGGDRGGYSGGSGNFKGNGGFKREFRKNDGERSSADRGGRSFSDRNERGVGSDSRKPRHEGGFKPRNKW